MSEWQIKPKLTEDTIRKLSQAFSLDCSVKEACMYANISTDTYYRWIKEFPELSDEFERLRQLPIFRARMRVIKGIDESFDNALKYLKVKKRDEFWTAKPVEPKKEDNSHVTMSNDFIQKLIGRMNPQGITSWMLTPTSQEEEKTLDTWENKEV